MLDWMSPLSFFQSVLRVAIIWLAFYGSGQLVRHRLGLDKAFPLMPAELTGLITFVLLTVPLSFLGILNRIVCPVLMLVFSLPGLLMVYARFRDSRTLRKPDALQILFGLVFVLVLILNFTYASMPNIAFDDPLITYAVQPDRWLNSGRIFWLEETVFSGFPLFYEMTAVWPASMASNSLNQLSLLQVFQMSLLLLATLRSMSILQVNKRFWLPVLSVVLLTTSLYNWCSLAKTDTMALFFSTLAIACAIQQQSKGFTGSPFTSWFVMGLALATKQTALIMLIPFTLYSIKSYLSYSRNIKILAIALLIVVPGLYGIRTMIMTGSPTYPFYSVSRMLDDDWVLHHPEEQKLFNDRSSLIHESKAFPLLKQVGIFFGHMEGNILLLAAGFLFALGRRDWRDAALAIPLLVAFGAAIAVFWPPWWGYKYSILLYPFSGVLGAKLIDSSKNGLTVISVILALSIGIPGFVAVAGDGQPFARRLLVASSVLRGKWDSSTGYSVMPSSPENSTQLWANSALPENSTILSLHEEKRYFFNGRVIVGWRHPISQDLYLDNTIEDEMSILNELGVDYVGFYRSNPLLLDQENRLRMLDSIGVGSILEPVIIIEDYLLCRVHSHQDATP